MIDAKDLNGNICILFSNFDVCVFSRSIKTMRSNQMLENYKSYSSFLLMHTPNAFWDFYF